MLTLGTDKLHNCNSSRDEETAVARDPYSVLGVARGSSDAEIKKAYRKLAKDLHPDRNADDPKAAERFKEVSAAYAILGDADKRARFDRGEIGPDGAPRSPFEGAWQSSRGGAGGGHGGGFAFDGDPMDIFSQFFSGGARRRGGGFGGGGFGGGGFGGGGFGGAEARTAPRPKGRNYEYTLEIPFEEAARLEPQRLTLRTGKTLQVKLPAGFEEGQQIRLAGQGDPGPGGAGDALVTLRIKPHAWFRREGDNVLLDLPLRLDEAVLGAKVKVPTVDGAVVLSVPAGSTSGKMLRLRGKGFTRKGGARGDQLVRLMVDTGEPDEDLKRFVQNWAAGKRRNPRSAWGLS